MAKKYEGEHRTSEKHPGHREWTSKDGKSGAVGKAPTRRDTGTGWPEEKGKSGK